MMGLPPTPDETIHIHTHTHTHTHIYPYRHRSHIHQHTHRQGQTHSHTNNYRKKRYVDTDVDRQTSSLYNRHSDTDSGIWICGIKDEQTETALRLEMSASNPRAHISWFTGLSRVTQLFDNSTPPSYFLENKNLHLRLQHNDASPNRFYLPASCRCDWLLLLSIFV